MHSLEPAEDLAIQLVRRFLKLCENPRTRSMMLRLVRNSTGEGNGRRFYSMVNKTVLLPMMRARGIQSSAMKSELIISQLTGIAVLRYVVKVEPMASASIDDVVRLAAPSIRAALKADVGRQLGVEALTVPEPRERPERPERPMREVREPREPREPRARLLPRMRALFPAQPAAAEGEFLMDDLETQVLQFDAADFEAYEEAQDDAESESVEDYEYDEWAEDEEADPSPTVPLEPEPARSKSGQQQPEFGFEGYEEYDG